jgi:(2R)-3-sulfolactate dehydrogenase (NADP+)
MKRFDAASGFELAFAACRGAGANEATARSLAMATVSAELHRKASVGFRHLLDYLAGLEEGRIVRDAAPRFIYPTSTAIQCDAGGGIAQLGFDLAFPDLVDRCETLGVAVFSQRASFTAGELGYYARRFAKTGYVALAATNGPALVAVPGGRSAVYCTNPIAFAAPVADGAPLVIDQATSATAYVNIRARAERGEPLPPGWAVDADGRETTDAASASCGALLTFGGARGANIALMVEILAAGLTGANWSLDAPSFASGARSPGAGLLVIAIAPKRLAPDFAERLRAQCERLEERGVHIPNRSGRPAKASFDLPSELVERVEAYRGRDR